MNLHRTAEVPQWDLVEPHERNKWQIRAAETNGWDTPANRISALGLASTLTGLFLTTRKGVIPKVAGVGLVGIGRWQDIRDGKKAEETGTKSPTGEAVDAAIDKVGLAAALASNFVSKAVPTAEMAAHGAQQLIGNVLLTTIAKVRGNEIHPGFLGKSGTGLLWLSLGSHLSALAAQEAGFDDAAEKFRTAGTRFGGAALALNTAGMVVDYIPAAFGSGGMTEAQETAMIQGAISERGLCT